MGVGVGREEVRIEHLILGPRDRGKDGGGLVLAGDRQILILEDLLHEGLLVDRIVDHEVRVKANSRTVTTQDAGAHGMERTHGHFAAGLLTDEAGNPGPQLGRGLVGEGDGEYLPRPNATDSDQVGDTVREHPRLACLLYTSPSPRD